GNCAFKQSRFASPGKRLNSSVSCSLNSISNLTIKFQLSIWLISSVQIQYKANISFCFVRGVMTEPISVKVSNRYQIALPSLARKELNIQAGDRLLVDIQDGMIILLPQPQDYVEYLTGLHKDIWQNINTTSYLQQEREAWQTSNND
ncbi:MAG TPA: AbrB/MazE/SpoVT family DNA-binding domain-containing protein, partial [Anaerolineae bacterium]|nr:AbrB/MazE/SpoVT family DNA-binding domain-containing protein [Anaerolineae bacterium]